MDLTCFSFLLILWRVSIFSIMNDDPLFIYLVEASPSDHIIQLPSISVCIALALPLPPSFSRLRIAFPNWIEITHNPRKLPLFISLLISIAHPLKPFHGCRVVGRHRCEGLCAVSLRAA